MGFTEEKKCEKVMLSQIQIITIYSQSSYPTYFNFAKFFSHGFSLHCSIYIRALVASKIL